MLSLCNNDRIFSKIFFIFVNFCLARPTQKRVQAPNVSREPPKILDQSSSSQINLRSKSKILQSKI